MARLKLSAGILTAFASWIAFRRRGLPSASPPPIRAAIVISLMSFVNMRPRFASIAPFLCLILCHLEWPDIDLSLKIRQIRFQDKPPGRFAPPLLDRRGVFFGFSGFLFGVGADFRVQSLCLFRLINGGAG